jgi:hypothetical protein
MSGPACILPGAVISPDFISVDFALIPSPLTLIQSNAHNIRSTGAAPSKISLNQTPSIGESYQVSNVGAGTLTLVGIGGLDAVVLASMTAVTVFYDGSAQYKTLLKVALI